MALVAIGCVWLLSFAAVLALGFPWWLPAAVLGSASPVGWAARGARTIPWLTIVAAVALAAGLRAHSWAERGPPPLASYLGSNMDLTGVIVSAPSRGLTTTRYTLEVRSASSSGETRPVSGRALLVAGEYAELARGSAVRVRGLLAEPPVFPEFDYGAYLLRKGIVGTLYQPQVEVIHEPDIWHAARAVTEARLALERSLSRSLPEPEAALAAGVLLGRDGALDREVQEDFRRSGLSHITAVSGSNVALVAGLVFLALAPAIGRRRQATWPSLALVLLYVALAGASWSVLRAGLMACVFLVGHFLGRPRSALAGLAGAAIALTAISPGAALDPGFQLSLAATAGIIVYGPWLRWGMARLSGPVVRAALPDLVYQGLSLSLSATLATLPISWAWFGQLSIVGPLANVIVEPLFVPAFVLAAVTGGAGIIWQPAGWAAGLAAFYPLLAMVRTASVLAAPDHAMVGVPLLSPGWAAAICAALCAASWPLYRRYPPDLPPARRSSGLPTKVLRGAAASGLLALAVLAVMTTTLLPLRGPGAFKLEALDVGQGDALLITTPRGRQVLVDGGPSGLRLVQELGRSLPHWDRTIDLVVLTHPQQDHVAGLVELYNRFDVTLTLDTGVANASATARLFKDSARPREVSAGAAFTLDGVLLEVLWPPAGHATKELNDMSVVLRLTYGSTTFLLTGDLEEAAGRELIKRWNVAATVLKVPHHGAKTMGPAFFTAVSPRIAVISVGAGNRFGHPAQQTLDALAGAEVLRTDTSGRVTVTSDGERVTTHTSR